jgi:tetratricopeptide (TPR) repeat protein
MVSFKIGIAFAYQTLNQKSKTMRHLQLLGLCLGLFLLSGPLMAQSSFNWPADPAKEQATKSSYVRMTDARKTGDTKLAHKELVYLMEVAPDLSESLYIAAHSVFEELVDTESDAKRKMELQDSVALTYDLRIKYFGEEVEVLNRKLLKAYPYFANRDNRLESLVKDFKRLFEIADFENIREYHALFYFDALRRHKKNNNYQISDEEVLELYEKLNLFLDQKLEGASPKLEQQIAEWKTNLDGILADMVSIDCEFIQNNLGQQYLENPSDFELGKKIVGLSLNLGCLDTEVFSIAAENVNKVEPQKGLVRFLASRAVREERYDDAMAYYKQLQEMMEDNVEQAEVIMDMANIYNNRGQKARARELYLQAVNTDPSQKEAYTRIGDMIMNSFNQCKREVSQVDDRALFIAAYEMYRLAGNGQRMAQAKAQFPTAEMIFTEGKEVGQDVRVGCWIQTTVKIQRAE